jgi:outer membrane protein insertion porin family
LLADCGPLKAQTPPSASAVPAAATASGQPAVLQQATTQQANAPQSAVAVSSAPLAVAVSTQQAAVAVSSPAVSVDVSSAAAAVAVSTEAEVDVGDGPWMICALAADGLKLNKEKVIFKHVKAKRGELYDKTDIGKDVQDIVGLGDFSKAEVDISAMPGEHKDKDSGKMYPCRKITYRVAERPIIDEIVFEGRKELSKGTLTDEMSLKEGDPYDEVKMIDDVRKIKEKYSQKGYINARADYAASPGKKPNTVKLTVNVAEGAQARVKTVEFTGVTGYPQKKVIKQTKNRPDKVYSPSDMDQDKRDVEDFYRNDGYYDFKIDTPTVSFNAEQSEVYIKYNVTEGPKAVFGDTVFAGNLVLKTTDLATAEEYVKGKTFNQEYYDDTIRAIQEKYANIGHLKAAIKPEKTYDPANRVLNIKFNIEENSIIYVDHIDVGGNKATKTYVLRREISLKEGDVFSAAKVKRSQQKLMNLGFLDDVVLDIQPTSDPDKVDLGFDVVEGKPGMLTLGATVSSTDGLYGDMSIKHMNLFGKAEQLALNWQIGSRVLNYSISWTTPWIDEKPISFGVDLFDTSRERPYSTTSDAYTDKRVGGTVRLGPRFDDDKYELNLAYTYETINISDVDTTYASTIAEGTSTTSKISAEFAVDTRDNKWDPTTGMRNAVSFELSGGPLFGDVDLYKTGFTSTWNHKLFSVGDYPFVWGISNRFGLMGRYGSTTDVPVYEKYFLGGADTIRGYDNTGQVGPANGGTVFYIFNTELRFPIARERRHTIVQGAFFFDMGNDWDNINDISFETGSSTNQLKMGAGFGIRFTTPAFPIRLDWGYGFNHSTGESKSQLYFTMGNLF